MSDMRRRHSNRELGIVKLIGRHHASGLRFASLGRDLRAAALPLWREHIVEIFYQQLPDHQPSFVGPHYSLTASGRLLAAALGVHQIAGETTGFGPRLGASSGGESSHG